MHPSETLPAIAPLVLATRNPGKVAEMRRLLAPHPWRVLTLDEVGVGGEIEEPGPGYLENAGAKAAAVCAATGLVSLADDSGIEVDTLGGWPGPRSARWREGSDADRMHGLVDEVRRRGLAEGAGDGGEGGVRGGGLPPNLGRLRYVAVVVLARPDGEPIAAHGTCEGVLLERPRGTGGFGYDPVFFSPELGMTFAEASPEGKDRVSHRARAIARLAESGVLAWPFGQLGAG